jgi:hypothetical protein
MLDLVELARANHRCIVFTSFGSIGCSTGRQSNAASPFAVYYESDAVTEKHQEQFNSMTWFGFARLSRADAQTSIVPIWLPLVILSAVGLFTCLGCFDRFSLRMLLIATTAAAILLGLAAWMVR